MTRMPLSACTYCGVSNVFGLKADTAASAMRRRLKVGMWRRLFLDHLSFGPTHFPAAGSPKDWSGMTCSDNEEFIIVELPRPTSPMERPNSAGSGSGGSERWDYVPEYQMTTRAACSSKSYAEAVCAGPFKAVGMGGASRKQPGRFVSAALRPPRRESQAPRAPRERWGEAAFHYM
jgi:hypothetical protein